MKIFATRHSPIALFLRRALIVVPFLFPACHKKPAAPVPPPIETVPAPELNTVPEAITPPLTGPASGDAPAPEGPPVPSHLDSGLAHFQAGDYEKAARALESFLHDNPESRKREQALFFLGLARAIATGASHSLLQSEAALRRLVAEFPESRHRRTAEYVLRLHSQIEKMSATAKEQDEKIRQLGEELQRLKEIDMMRRASRPAQ